MSANKVEICGVDTSSLKTLTEEEKRDLLTKVRNGDKLAREKLILGNLRLVLSVSGRFMDVSIINEPINISIDKNRSSGP